VCQYQQQKLVLLHLLDGRSVNNLVQTKSKLVNVTVIGHLTSHWTNSCCQFSHTDHFCRPLTNWETAGQHTSDTPRYNDTRFKRQLVDSLLMFLLNEFCLHFTLIVKKSIKCLLRVQILTNPCHKASLELCSTHVIVV